MKNINTIITSILAIAIAVLFYLQFSSNKKNSTIVVAKPQSGKSSSIAYFEMDSIQNQYELYKDVIKELTKKEQDVRNVLAQKKNENSSIQRKYQEKFKDLKQSNITEADQAAAMQATQHLQELDKTYQQEEQQLANQLSDETRTKLGEVKKKIEDFLKEYNKNNVYSFIISNSNELIYYKDTTYNITNDVIKGLNAEYKKKKIIRHLH